ncbi:MAG: epoxyqueuosine reductase [Candidatus Helarchaeota archaeon]
MDQGAVSVGFATKETLTGGPPSSDLTYVFPEANSAVCLAIPLDRDKIRSFFMKKLPNGRIEHETDNIQAYVTAYKASFTASQFLRSQGYKAEPLIPNFKYRNDIPGWRLRSLPPVSLRYLAVRSGVGAYGWSGNVGLKGYGTAIILGGLVTSAKLEPTDPIPSEESFCTKCKLCVKVCPLRMFSENEPEFVELGGYSFSFAKRLNLIRCFISCGGFSGLDKSGQWSTWSPGRQPYPETDEEVIDTLAKSFKLKIKLKIPGEAPGFDYKQYIHDPEFQEALSSRGIKRTIKMIKNTTLTCGNCQLVCWGDPEETAINYRILTSSGCVLKDENGNLIVLNPENARKMFEELQKRRTRNILLGEASSPSW